MGLNGIPGPAVNGYKASQYSRPFLNLHYGGTMKALQIIDGDLCWSNHETLPRPCGQVRIRVAAAGLNRADLLQQQGIYAPPPGASAILGLECAGIIVEADDDSAWKAGDRVCALLSGGGMAEEAIVPDGHILPVPQGLSLAQAAVLPEVYATVWLNLFELAALQPGEKVLIHAGASGVGSAAIQLCKAFGNPCLVSVGSEQRLQHCLSLGASGGVLRGSNLEELLQHRPFNVILDPVASPYAKLNLDLLDTDGRWIIIAMMGGYMAELDLAKLLYKRTQIIGSTLRSRNDTFKAQLLGNLKEHVWPLFENGKLQPCLERSLPVQEADHAYEIMKSNQVNGKLALLIDPELN